MKCEICKLATIEYNVLKGQILCPDCAHWVLMDEEVVPMLPDWWSKKRKQLKDSGHNV